MIMRLSFPRTRKVILNAGFRHLPLDSFGVERRRYSPRLLPALHINSESRREVLERYSVVTKADFEKWHLTSFGPLFFDQATDTFQLQSRGKSFPTFASVKVVESMFPEKLAQIKRIELLFDYPQVTSWRHFLRDSISSPLRSDHQGDVEGKEQWIPFEGLLHLSGLERVVFSIFISRWDAFGHNVEKLFDDLQSLFQQVLEKRKYRFAHGNAPTVKFRRV
ncbi:uncharacterized protein LY89DRAFT_186203 [Mollisia scopiformis]|uniref:Uncharacterized protein n=1 Tax=Mollisia scopiformis TaxID=149040 RepID=A0A194XV42_MOLSC|nr:uncharacterized protein LY89DRAFT_186203 [Mollisia scopiformis]KUJ23577.1 hypothetical protein LY89DRAFT_186203 [Mollisia scopiformis]